MVVTGRLARSPAASTSTAQRWDPAHLQGNRGGRPQEQAGQAAPRGPNCDMALSGQSTPAQHMASGQTTPPELENNSQEKGSFVENANIY